MKKTDKYIMSREQMQSVWQNANWQKVIDVFGLEVDQRRRNKTDEIWIKSPFSNDKKASLHLDLNRNIFKDFSSGKGAQKGILNFCQDLLAIQGNVLNCYEAAKWMIDNGVSCSVPDIALKSIPIPQKLRDEKEKKNLSSVPYETNKPIRVDLRPFLRLNHPELKKRGVSPTTCRYLGCGYLPISNNGIKYSPLNGRIVFQLRGVVNDQSELNSIIITHVGRALTRNQESMYGKYWSFPFKKRLEIFNQDKIINDNEARKQIKQYGLILVEGFFDVALLVESGCFNVGALMGVELSKMQLNKLKSIDTSIEIPKIRLFFDRDNAGLSGTQKVLSMLHNNGFKTEIFDWNQKFYRSKDLIVKIPERIKDAGDMTKVQIQWLRNKGII